VGAAYLGSRPAAFSTTGRPAPKQTSATGRAAPTRTAAIDTATRCMTTQPSSRAPSQGAAGAEGPAADQASDERLAMTERTSLQGRAFRRLVENARQRCGRWWLWPFGCWAWVPDGLRRPQALLRRPQGLRRYYLYHHGHRRWCPFHPPPARSLPRRAVGAGSQLRKRPRSRHSFVEEPAPTHARRGIHLSLPICEEDVCVFQYMHMHTCMCREWIQLATNGNVSA
jgi:hypothetical protein